MKKIILTAFLSLFMYQFALAQEADIDSEEENAFGFPDKSIVAIIENNNIKKTNKVNIKPDCNDAQMMLLAQETLKTHINTPYQTITNKRRHDLILKNIANFTDLSVENVDLKLNRPVAARLVELKINNHLNDSNIKICQSDNPVLSTKLYLIMYDKKDDIVIEIINFQQDLKPSFIWHK